MRINAKQSTLPTIRVARAPAVKTIAPPADTRNARRLLGRATWEVPAQPTTTAQRNAAIEAYTSA